MNKNKNRRFELEVRKAFRIKNSAGQAIILPRGYKLKAVAKSYQKELIEMWKVHCQADGNYIKEDTMIWDVPSEFINFVEDND